MIHLKSNFAGMVSLLPTIDSRLFHIKGGNKLLAQKLINATGANLQLGQKVTAIHRDKHGRYDLYTRHTSAAVEVQLSYILSCSFP